MHPLQVPGEVINEIMYDWSKGKTFAEIASKFNRSKKSIEGIITRNRGEWTRDFNFPHITHAKRFGA